MHCTCPLSGAAFVLGRCDDGLIGLLALHLNRVARYTGLLGRVRRAIQHARGVLLDLLGMFGGFLRYPPPCRF